jgi:vancomycin resistance protein VanJ
VSRPPRRWRRLLNLATALTVAAAAVHLAGRDANAVTAPVTYAAPWPLVLAAAFVLASIHTYRRSWRLVILSLGLFTLAAWQWLGLWGTSPPPVGPGPECRLLFWNAASPTHPSRPLVDAVRDQQSDLIVLAEAGEGQPQTAESYARELPGYRVHEFPHEIMVLSKGNVSLRASRILPNRSSVRILECETPAGPVTLEEADLGSNPLADRKPIVRAVLDMAPPDAIVLGDFNTPYDSVTFDSYRERYTHALKHAGRGPIETWPYIFPCLAIDHVWLPPAFAVASAEKRWTVQSDHAMVLVTFVRK